MPPATTAPSSPRPQSSTRINHRPEAAPAHPHGHGVGGGDGPSARQPVRSDRPGARSPPECCASHAGVASRRGGVRDREGAGVQLGAGREASLRVPRADGDALRRGPGSRVDGDRPGRGRVDHPGRAHEGEPRAPRPAQPSSAGDSRGGALARSGQPARVSERARQAAREYVVVGPAQGAEDRGRATRVPVVVPGLGGRGDRSSTRGGGGGAGAQGPQPGRGSVPAHGSVRAPASADERLGRVSGPRASRIGGRSDPRPIR